jgi:hypothetical protein
MSTTPATRRRLLLRVTAAALGVGLAGCSGAPGGGSPGTGPESGTDPGDDADQPEGTAGGAPTDGGRNESVTTTATGTSADGAPGTDTTSPPADGAGTTTSGGDHELDLREANVVGVAFTAGGDRYRFDVTLYHDDDGEAGYANWWQVETLDGQQLGRRELLHAHSTAPFTRSETVSIPAGTTYVVVRGHDQTHGYGGQAVVVNLDTGGTQSVQQGPEPRDLSGFEPSV